MEQEVRGIQLSFLNRIEDENIILGIGTEGCVHKFCKDMQELIINKIPIKNKITIVTPRVPEKYSVQVFDYLREVCKKYEVNSLIINDYGILYRLQEEKITDAKFILGRTLIRGLAYTPWSSIITKDEEYQVKENLMMTNIYHKSKLELYKTLNISGVELCATALLDKTVEKLHQEKFDTYIHYDTVIATIGRTCPIIRMKEKEIGNCEEVCAKYVNVQLEKVFGQKGIIYTEPSEQVKELVPTYMNHENVVYYRVKEVEKSDLYNRLIYDYVLDYDYVQERIFCNNSLYKK